MWHQKLNLTYKQIIITPLSKGKNKKEMDYILK